mmetsp:Transcript_40363/g.67322  ORF Transcript_40363/g.67322 Transcript_40363/m.67322 type:complete len:106 (+) Transcript_40363:243-560(+)
MVVCLGVSRLRILINSFAPPPPQPRHQVKQVIWRGGPDGCRMPWMSEFDSRRVRDKPGSPRDPLLREEGALQCRRVPRQQMLLAMRQDVQQEAQAEVEAEVEAEA